MPAQIIDGDLVFTPARLKEGAPDVTPEVFPNPAMMASGQLACSLGIPFCTPAEGSIEIGPAPNEERGDSHVVDPWLEYHLGM